MKLMKVKDPDTVLDIIEDNFFPLEGEKVSLEKAGGMCLAESIIAADDLPGFNRSTVDGYAVNARDTFGAGEGLPSVLDCKGEILMGQAAPAMEQGQCCQIHTGGMLPQGADAVVMVEDTEITGDTVNVYRQVAPGSNIIRKGEDVTKGVTVFEAGRHLRSAEIGVLASLGVTQVKAHRRPVMGMFSSGDELVPVNTKKLEAAQIRESNSYSIAYLGERNGAKVINGGILPDVFEEFFNKSRAMLDNVDFLVLTGGSSVGTRDFTARTLQELGEPGLLVEGVSMQPGKPTLLANCNGKPVLGLPGHPVSALNTFIIFGKAVLNRLSGHRQRQVIPAVNAVLTRNLPSRSGRTDYVRVKLERKEDGFAAVPVFGRSGMLRTLADADGFVIVESAKEGLPAGEKVQVHLWE